MVLKTRSAIPATIVIVVLLSVGSYYGLMSATVPRQITTQSSLTSKLSQNETTANWPTYHGNPSRSGFEPSIVSFNLVHLNWKSITLDGSVYAEPLIVGKDVIIATENDSLYDLTANTGQVMWRNHLGTPVNGGELPCGNIDPSGITGTPVVDASRRIIYVVAFMKSPARHELFAIDLDTGQVKFHSPVDPPGADPTVQQQRAALALSGGYVYVAYGGLAGDCGTYHGWVVASKADQSTANSARDSLLSYQVPTGWAGGIWAPSGPAVDELGNLFIATGNSGSSSTFDFGNAVIRLSRDLRQLDWFAPSNWIQLNDQDRDLGSTGPIILNSTVVFQIGKDGIGYLLNAQKLGGIGGQLFSVQVCSEPGAGAFGGSAYSPPYLIVPCTNGIVVLEINPAPSPSFNVVWRGPNFDSGPPIVAGNAVWTVDVRKGMIYALDLKDGRILFQDSIGSVTHFTSLGAGDDRIFVSASRRVMAYILENSSQGYITRYAGTGSFNGAGFRPSQGPLHVETSVLENVNSESRALRFQEGEANRIEVFAARYQDFPVFLVEGDRGV